MNLTDAVGSIIVLKYCIIDYIVQEFIQAVSHKPKWLGVITFYVLDLYFI